MHYANEKIKHSNKIKDGTCILRISAQRQDLNNANYLKQHHFRFNLAATIESQPHNLNQAFKAVLLKVKNLRKRALYASLLLIKIFQVDSICWIFFLVH